LATSLGLAAESFTNALASGIRIVVLHERHRTNFPRAAAGTARMRWHDSFGHMMRMTFGSGFVVGALTTWLLRENSLPFHRFRASPT
jgi:hypothetical protein